MNVIALFWHSPEFRGCCSSVLEPFLSLSALLLEVEVASDRSDADGHFISSFTFRGFLALHICDKRETTAEL